MDLCLDGSSALTLTPKYLAQNPKHQAQSQGFTEPQIITEALAKPPRGLRWLPVLGGPWLTDCRIKQKNPVSPLLFP